MECASGPICCNLSFVWCFDILYSCKSLNTTLPHPPSHHSQIAFPKFWKLDEEWNTSNRTRKDVWIASLMITEYKSQSALDRCHLKYSNLKCYVLLQVQVFLLIFTYHQTTWNYNFLFREYVKYIGPWSCIVKKKS